MKSPFNKPFGSRSPFGPQSGGGGGGAAPVLTLVYDGLADPTPTYLFDCDQVADGYLEVHSTATPPGIGNGDIDSLSLGSLIAGENDLGTIDLSPYDGQNFYLHIYADNANGTDVLTTQEIEMALVDVGPYTYPQMNFGGGSASTDSNMTNFPVSSGQNSQIADVHDEDITPNYVTLRLNGSGATPAATISIESVSATTGLADGVTVYATVSTDAGGSVPALTGTATTHEFPMSSVTTIPAGTPYALKLAHKTGTTITPYRGTHGFEQGNRAIPYEVNNAGTKAALSVTAGAHYAIGSSTTSFYKRPSFLPGVSNIASTTFNSNASRGLRASLPFAARIIGIQVWCGTFGNFDVKVYDDQATPVIISAHTKSFDIDQTSFSTNSTLKCLFAAPLLAAKDTFYNFMVEATSATNCSIPTLTFLNTNYRAASVFGENMHLVTRSAVPVWDKTLTTQAPMISLIIDQH